MLLTPSFVCALDLREYERNCCFGVFFSCYCRQLSSGEMSVYQQLNNRVLTSLVTDRSLFDLALNISLSEYPSASSLTEKDCAAGRISQGLKG